MKTRLLLLTLNVCVMAHLATSLRLSMGTNNTLFVTVYRMCAVSSMSSAARYTSQ